MAAAPPRFWHAILKRALPADVRDAVLRDLDEVFQLKSAQHGEAAARRWYRREALSFSWRFTRERFAFRRRGVRFSLIDVKLAGRMVLKYPGLTIVGGTAIAIAIAVTTVAFEITHDFADPVLPLAHGDRIVALQMWDGRSLAAEPRVAYDLARWRGAKSIQETGAFYSLTRTLILEDGRGEAINAAVMSASGFRVAAVAPLMGRTLVDADEASGAPPVAVIGYSLWQTRFNGDPQVLGRTIHLGAAPGRMIVGVMPDGFLFPVKDSLWIPLTPPDPFTLKRFDGPGLHAFALLAPGYSRADAARELSAISGAEPPDPSRPAPLVPSVTAFPLGLVSPGFIRAAYKIQGVLVVIFVICCANVATLVFARTATRQAEISVRAALGASRGRILSQFFIEALVLAGLSATAGLFAARFVISRAMILIWSSGNTRPFWWDDGISTATLWYAGALTLLVAAICGVVPALKGTRRDTRTVLEEASGRGSTLRFGLASTGVIILQVALCVALLPAALSQAWIALQAQAGATGFPTHEYLSTALSVDSESEDRRAAIFRDLERRVRQEPDVRGVAFAASMPGSGTARVRVEVEGDDYRNRERPNACTTVVSPGFFESVEIAPTNGRVFGEADAEAGAKLIVINQPFADRVIGARNAIGRRIRVATADNSEPWLEIIGVVPDLTMNPLRPDLGEGFYRVARPGESGVSQMAVHVASDASAFAPRLRAIAAAVNPAIQLHQLLTLDEAGRVEQFGFRFFSFSLLAIGVMGVVLATAGIYAMMSFTVSRRMREIAIRAALGGSPRRIVVSIFSRAALQIAAGALVGVGLAFLEFPQTAREIWLPIGLACFLAAVGIFACLAPARRALRIQPSDALKDVG